jgi:hypothetical protein
MSDALRQVLASFGFDLDTKTLEEGDKLVNGFIGTLKGVGAALAGAFAVGVVKDFVVGLVEEADALNDSANALSITTGALQEFQYAADLGGSKAEAVTAALQRLQRKADPKAIKELGFNLKEFQGLSTTDQFEEIAQKVSEIKDPAKAAGIASKFFGKSVATLMPLLKQGKSGIQQLRAEFHEMGGGFGDDFVANAAEFKDEMDRLDLIFKSIKIRIVGEFLPALRSALLWFREMAGRGIHIVDVFSKWAKTTALLKTGFMALALRGVAFLSGKLGPLGALFRRLAVWALKSLLPFLLLEDAFVFLAGGDSLIGAFLDKIFGKGTQGTVLGWINGVKDSVLGFLDDLQHRPLKLIDDWNVFTTALRADVEDLFGPFFGGWLSAAGELFVYFVNMLTGGWDNFVNKMTASGDGILLALQIVWTEVKFGFLSAAAAISDAFDGVWNSVRAGAGEVLDIIGKIPGVDVSATVKGLKTAQGGQSGAEVSALRDKARTGLAGQYDAIAAKATASSTPAALTSQVNVVVQGSADKSTAAKVGAAAAKGSAQGLGKARSAQAALAQKPQG